jgi:hypothetical protein
MTSSRTIALRVVSILRITATITTFGFVLGRQSHDGLAAGRCFSQMGVAGRDDD